MPKFRKKPVEIEAIRFLPDLTCEALYEWAGIPYYIGQEPKPEPFRFENGTIGVHTLEGWVVAQPGTWILKGVRGEFYPCRPDIFEATYEPVEGATP